MGENTNLAIEDGLDIYLPGQIELFRGGSRSFVKLLQNFSKPGCVYLNILL
jgi:hypothetical protein